MRLCEIPGCRIRNRHLPDCTEEQCTGCLPRIAEDGHVCGVHVSWAMQWLLDIDGLTAPARLVASGLVRRGMATSSGKPGSRPPINTEATDALDEIQNAITTIARDIAETRNLIGPRGADPLRQAATWLCGQMDWLRLAVDEQGTPRAIAVFAEIREQVGHIRWIVDGPGQQKFLGPCGAAEQVDVTPFGHPPGSQTVDGARCAGDVYGRPNVAKGRCKTCGAEYEQDERRAWLDVEVRQYAYTAAEIADAYPIKANTIRQWLSRGLLVPHGEIDGKPLLNLGEVLDLAAGDAARREEARATRARRAAVKADNEGAAA